MIKPSACVLAIARTHAQKDDRSRCGKPHAFKVQKYHVTRNDNGNGEVGKDDSCSYSSGAYASQYQRLDDVETNIINMTMMTQRTKNETACRRSASITLSHRDDIVPLGARLPIRSAYRSIYHRLRIDTRDRRPSHLDVKAFVSNT